ncbi:unnamed protein product [Cyclocybe aegerita]|uniref:Thiamine-binding protein domain-containing protein n=1 Tax=Cyclocybe aegerita TaxID=1973307 RepID=A0A8S0W5T1_CYCAE|nr:unnamed protein product [Cyclocybe aegerita]
MSDLYAVAVLTKFYRYSELLASLQISYQANDLPSGSGYGTNIEGPWSKVSQAIHDCHAAVHAKGAQRIATDIRIGTRIDREIPFGEGNDGKVKRVERILARERQREA